MPDPMATILPETVDIFLRGEFDRHLRWLQRHDIELAQNNHEFFWLWRKVKAAGFARLLEIGSREGGSLYVLARALMSPAQVVALDLPGAAWGRHGSEAKLRQVLSALNQDGIDVEYLAMDSHAGSSVAAVKDLAAPELFDCLFIDGDHSYQGVKRDFYNYRSLVRPGGMIVFHDLVAPQGSAVEVGKLWREIGGDYTVEENVLEWGIGILYVG